MAVPPITAHIDRASFSVWSKNDIKKISVKKITEVKSFEKAGKISQDGLYSDALGVFKRMEQCATCGLTDINCPGHFGHIELVQPVYHPMLVQTIYQLLTKCCLECYHFRLAQNQLKLFLAQLDALNNGFDHLIEELDEIAAEMFKDYKGNDEDYMTVTLCKKLVARVEEEKEKTPDFDVKKRPQQRSIVERLSKLFRNFMIGQFLKPSKICPNCGEKKQAMSLHQQSVIVLGTNSSKPLDDDQLATSIKVSRSRKKTYKKVVKELEKDDPLHYLKTDEKKFLTPLGARYCLRQLWKNESQTMKRIFHFLNLETHPSVKVAKDEEEEQIETKQPEEVKAEEEEVKEEENEEAIQEEDGEVKVEEEVKEEKPVLNLKLKKEQEFQPVDLFFIDTILVPPSKYRPPMFQSGYHFEGPRTAALSNVMKRSVVLQDIIDKMFNEKDDVDRERLQPRVQLAWKELQTCVNCLYDNEMDKYGKHKYPGLKQLIDKKEGLFRKNMMGKRVNYAARSVISPDPNILVDQIGVPLVFAKKLTYPEPVTPMNIIQMKEAVLNGPDKYPGATSVVFEDGFTVSLIKESVRQSVASRLSYKPRFMHNKTMSTPMSTIVNRHLLSGDVLLFNRQPTLHKPSIMAFRARVLPNEKGFRLHYANCKSFNADFDGDEMNAHLPQSELARSEAYNIASVNFQYLVPKDGSPLGGLIQDHVVAVCILTRRDQLFNKDRYNQLVYCALSFLDKPIKLEAPFLVKPVQMWTGKQVISTVIKNCIPDGKLAPSLNIKSKISPKILNIKREFEKLSDCDVIIRNGELLVGFMDKSNVGATQYGLIHTCYELYGGETSSALMSAFSRLSTWYLELYEGFTLGIGDILVQTNADEDRKKSIIASLNVGPDSAREALGVEGVLSEEELEDKLRQAHTDRDQYPMKKLDAAMKTRTDKITSEISSRCLPEGLLRLFPGNNLQMMIQSGAKGGTVNALQISCLLGQIELEGRRVPLSMSGRSLPSFKPYDTSPKAGGFVSGRFLTGIQPQEFFFHCMAGREGLIDTAVKTSRSGYLQRCLIKHLEGLTVQYDQTVRDSCGSVIQFLYGEDGLDICKCQMLKDKGFSCLVENHKIISPNDEEVRKLNKAKEEYEEDVITRTNDIQQWLEKNGEDRIRKLRGSGFLDFLASKLSDVKHSLDNSNTSGDFTAHFHDDAALESTKLHSAASQQSSQVSIKKQRSSASIGSHHHDQIFEAWYALSFKEKKKWNKQWELCPDPLIAVLNPGTHFGVVPEKLDERIESFVRANPQLIVDTAKLLGSDQFDSSNLDSIIACDENPELSKTLLTHWNQSVVRSSIPKLTKHEFYNLCYNLYIKMLAQPGEAVGLLAAQSIGEPSTQMTLNTFHFAGRGDMNVTLGIPRLREILMTASAKIGTPSMDLPLLKVMKDEFGQEMDLEAIENQAKRVKLALNAVRLSNVLEYIEITEQVIEEPFMAAALQGKQAKNSKRGTKVKKNDKSIRYDFTFSILPSKYYRHEYKSNSSKVLKFIEEEFVSQLVDSMCKRQKRLLLAEGMFDIVSRKNRERQTKSAKDANGEDDLEEQGLDDYNAKATAKEKAKEEDSSSEDDEDCEGDNTTQRIKNRRNQDLDYEEPEDDDLEVGDMEAKTAEVEENDKEILIDYEQQFNSENVDGDDQASANDTKKKEKEKLKKSLRFQEAVDEEEDEDEDDDDDEVAEVKRQIAEEQERDEKPLGQSLDIAAFEESNSRSGFVTPAHEASIVEEAEGEAEQLEEGEPSRKRKRIDLFQVVEAASNKLKAGNSNKSRSSKLDSASIEQRIIQVKGKANVVDYQFDTKRERWCKLSVCMELTTTRLDIGALVEAEARRTFVHRVGNIQRALIVKDVNARSRGAKCEQMIKTEGVSLLSLVRFNHILDLNAIYSNDIHAIANTYGIEAASQAIRREMANVFAVYGIEVDSRHLSLIADYMTYNGSIRGMNRMSMEASASPFQQMSFESTIRYLKWAAILGLYDDIKSPSASLVFGRPTRGGTGIFSLLADEPVKEQELIW